MTVASESHYRELNWTGAETSFSPGFAAEDRSHVTVRYLDDDATPVDLTIDVHFSVTLDSSGNVTVTPLSLPGASVDEPVTLLFERVTPALQGADFANLGAYDPTTFQTLFDRVMRIAAEVKGKVARGLVSLFTDDYVDFRPRRVKAAEPEDDTDVATKLYADTVSGSNAQAAAEAARDLAVAAAEAADVDRIAAEAAAAAAIDAAELLENPDYGFYTDVTSEARDYGTYA